MFKKLLLSFLTLLILSTSFLGLFVPTASAQNSTWYEKPFDEWYQTVFDENNPEEIFGERYTYAQVEWVIHSMRAFLTNLVMPKDLMLCIVKEGFPGDLVRCLPKILELPFPWLERLLGSSPNPESGIARGVKNENLLGVFTSRPISSIEYFKDIAQRLKIIPEAKAQGFGFEAGAMVLEIWKAVRDITYGLLIPVVIIIAFMIMFRVKISPQAVISVQSALPRVIFTLILITFSYAIAGFLIDLMYVSLGLLSAVLDQSNLVGLNWGGMFAAFTGRSIFELMGSYTILFGLGMFPAMIGSGVIATAIGAPLSGIVGILVAIMLLIATFKILWLMLKTYVNILLQIIAAPLIILVGAVGQFGGFGGWLKNMAANLAVYPTVAFLFVFAFVFLRGAFYNAGVLDPIIDKLFIFDIPSSLGGVSTWQAPFSLIEGSAPLTWLIVSLVIILLIPKVADIIKGIVSGRPFAYGTAIGEALGPALAAYGLARAGVRTGVESELGYRAAMLGFGLQQRGGLISRTVGRSLMAWGEPRAQTVRSRDTGEIERVGRRGTLEPGKVVDTSGKHT